MQKQNNTIQVRALALAIGFTVNSFGNALTIASNMGSEPWASASDNLHHLTGFSVGIFLFIFGVINAILNQIMLKEWDALHFIEEIFYISCFSYFVDLFLDVLNRFGVGQLGIPTRTVLSVLGVILFCSAISLYQRANIFMHPNDDTTNILRFKYLKGSAIWSQLVDILPSIIIIGVSSLLMGKVYSVNVGTIFSLICNGILIKYSDELIWPSLKHNHRKKHKLLKAIKDLS